MRRATLRAFRWAVGIGAVATLVALGRRQDTDLVVDAYLLFVGALALLLLVRALRALVPLAGPSQFERARRRRARGAARPEQLLALERETMLATETAFDLHFRLRPVLQEIAAQRLSTRRGLELDSDAAAEVLGPEAWELVRPDREAPHERFGPGVALGELRAAVAALERI